VARLALTGLAHQPAA